MGEAGNFHQLRLVGKNHMMYDRFHKKHPKRWLVVGISEASTVLFHFQWENNMDSIPGACSVELCQFIRVYLVIQRP